MNLDYESFVLKSTPLLKLWLEGRNKVRRGVTFGEIPLNRFTPGSRCETGIFAPSRVPSRLLRCVNVVSSPHYSAFLSVRAEARGSLREKVSLWTFSTRHALRVLLFSF
jgi:hypothetical protein